MIERLDVRSNDRFLLLSIPQPSFIAQLAARLPAGLIVGLGPDEEVRAARCELREVDNVMLVPASPDDIPWQDGFFTKAIDLVGRWPQPERAARELARVLVPGAAAYLTNARSTREHLLAAGFTEISSDGQVLVVQSTR
jgi:hypothetical protein